MEISKYSQIKADGMRLVVIYIMLENRQVVNYSKIYQMFEISYSTFARVIAQLRLIVRDGILCPKGVVIFNRRRNSYELIRF